MKEFLSFLLLIFSLATINAQSANKLKKELLSSIEQKTSELTSLSDKIWEAAEVAFREDKSAEYLIEYAEENGEVEINTDAEENIPDAVDTAINLQNEEQVGK